MLELLAYDKESPTPFTIPLYALGRESWASSGRAVAQQDDVEALVEGVQERRCDALVDIGAHEDERAYPLLLEGTRILETSPETGETILIEQEISQLSSFLEWPVEPCVPLIANQRPPGIDFVPIYEEKPSSSP